MSKMVQVSDLWAIWASSLSFTIWNLTLWTHFIATIYCYIFVSFTILILTLLTHYITSIYCYIFVSFTIWILTLWTHYITSIYIIATSFKIFVWLFFWKDGLIALNFDGEHLDD